MGMECSAQARCSVTSTGIRTRARPNRRERGFGFAYAVRVLAGPVLERVDGRRDYGEVRIQALGEIDGLLYVIVFTDREVDGRRLRWIISARRAHEKERRQ
ncbi:hypothetical protein LDDCCGHA_5745 [Methylobacterium oxalidis]|nr:hypothetical protein LDDCCGHA_5745 [Methylobacterium oxalidis]